MSIYRHLVNKVDSPKATQPSVRRYNLAVNFIQSSVKQNLAFLYIWLPLAVTVLGYFYPINRSVVIVTVYMSIAATAFSFFWSCSLRPLSSHIFKLFFAYVVIIAGLIIALSGNALVSFWFLFVYILLPFIIGALFFNQFNGRQIIINLLILAAVLFFVFGQNILAGIDQRAYVFGNPSNAVQLSLVCSFVLSFVFSGLRYKGIPLWGVFTCIFFVGVASGATLPRWFLLATIAIFFSLGFFRNGWRASGLMIFAFIVGWILALLFFDGRMSFYTENLIPRSIAFADHSDIAITSIEERVRFAQIGMELFFANPFHGIGVSNFGLASGGAIDSFPHFSMIQILSEMGIFVLILYITMLVCAGFIIFRGAKVNSSNIPWLMIFIYGVVFSIFHGNYLTDKLIYIALGYAFHLELRWIACGEKNNLKGRRAHEAARHETASV